MQTKKTKDRISAVMHRMPWCVAANILLLYVMYMVCRVVFVFVNRDMFGADLASAPWWLMLKGSLLFDSSAIFYTNILYLLIVLLPLHVKERRSVHVVAKWVYVVVNALCLWANLADSVYFPFSGKRTTMMVFDEFGSNTNIGTVIAVECWRHWYLVVLGLVMAWLLWRCYLTPREETAKGYRKAYYIRYILSLVIVGILAVAGMRGAFFSKSSRPIAMSNAHQYVASPSQTAIVLNTPFSVIRTASRTQAAIPRFYNTDTEMETWYTAVHLPDSAAVPDKKNVVILIVESFAEEFVGCRNRDLDGGTYRGYTPFVDSLMQHSLTFEHTYANGWISIDAMPSVLSSVPKMYTSFILTPYSAGDIPGIAKELGDWGYATAFFHGAENSSMGFQAFARAAGFDEYYGRTEYDADTRFGGEKDFDGTWAIWDEEFLQFMCARLDSMQQPFLASVFTASSHHPFALPERYRDVYPEEGAYPLHKCIRYTDNALRQFFATASKQPWYANTIFVLTADHASSRVTHDIYKTAEGDFRVPILIYDPSGKVVPGVRPGTAQQIDIMPTVLAALGYDRPYIAFGNNLLSKEGKETWAFNWHNVPQLIQDGWLLQYNDFKMSGLYDLKADPLMRTNLAQTGAYDKGRADTMIHRIQAIMQTYDTLMKSGYLRMGKQSSQGSRTGRYFAEHSDSVDDRLHPNECQ